MTVKPYIFNLKEAEAMAKAEFEARKTIRDKLKVSLPSGNESPRNLAAETIELITSTTKRNLEA